MRTAVIGAGGWGTTLALVLHEKGHDVTLWSRREDFARELRERRENIRYLKGIQVPVSIEITHDTEWLYDRELYVFALPSQATRAMATELSPKISHAGAVYVSASKGIEKGSLMRVTEIIAESLGVDSAKTVALSGPSHAEEVARGVPTAVVAAGTDHDVAREVQNAFSLPHFRVY
ncbi:MAG TPA: 2-dehydropantoate 2-reductase N-terminal domain-containing protein, partial [Candidatus Kapabacteria bacterium]